MVRLEASQLRVAGGDEPTRVIELLVRIAGQCCPQHMNVQVVVLCKSVDDDSLFSTIDVGGLHTALKDEEAQLN